MTPTFTLHVVNHADLPLLVAKALSGDRHAQVLTLGVSHFAQTTDAAIDPEVCQVCAQPLRRGEYAFALAFPDGWDRETPAVCVPVCAACSPPGNTSRTADLAIAALSVVWPGARSIDITHPSGGSA